MQSSESSVQYDPSERSLTTLVLDVLERLTILEQSFKYADLQRGEIVTKVNKLSEVCAAKEDVKIMARLVDEHEKFFNEFKFGMRVAKAGWAFVYVSGGTLFGAGIQWFLYYR